MQRGLDELGIHHELEPRLVRGFDYYTSTTFEFVSDALDAAQNAVLGGGLYDDLSEEIGGQPTPGIGFGMGIERLLIVADALGALPPPETRFDAFVVDGLPLVGGFMRRRREMHRVERVVSHELFPAVVARLPLRIGRHVLDANGRIRMPVNRPRR